MRTIHGYSLLELVVVMAVIAVLTGAAVVGYGPMLAAWRLNAAARQVIIDIKVARARAIGEGVSHRVHFSVQGNTYQQQRQGPSEQYAPTGPPTTLPTTIETTKCTAAGSNITFAPQGHTRTFGTITLQNAGGDQRQVVISIAGRMRVQ